jgi:tetratricopeptide (TPR) repeat protein
MSARLSIACLLLAALLLPRGPAVQAKPPDLPAVMPVTCTPFAPLRDDATVPCILEEREGADIHGQARAETGRRTLTRCLLFAAHPLLALLPLEDFFAEEEGQDFVFDSSYGLPEEVLGNLKKLLNAEEAYRRAEGYRRQGRFDQASALYTVARRLCPGSRYDWLAEARQRQLAAEDRTGTAAKEEDAAPAAAKPVSGCPYLRNQKMGRGPTVPGTFIEAASALENLDKLERAEQMFQEAESCRRRGHTVEAIATYEAIRTLCPGSRYDEMASDGLRALRAGAATEEEATETGPEELRGRLQSPINLDVTDMPLARVLDELRVLVPHGLSIKVDQSAIEAAGLNLRQPVTMKVEQVSVGQVLRQILRRTNLGYRIKDGALFITTPAGEEEESSPMGGKDQSRAPGKSHGVSELLESCQGALHQGHYAQADALARQALALDVEAVEAHPLVYKMHLFEQLRRVGRRQPLGLRPPDLPPGDPALARTLEQVQREAHASGLILEIDEAGGGEEQEPRERSVEEKVLFVKRAPTELFLAGDARAGVDGLAALLLKWLKPGSCVELELSGEGARGRLQFDLGSTGLRLTWERGGPPSLLIWTYGGSETGTDR